MTNTATKLYHIASIKDGVKIKIIESKKFEFKVINCEYIATNHTNIFGFIISI